MTEVTFNQPVLIFDADCAFCTRSVEFLKHKVRIGAEVVGYQFTDLGKYGTDAERASREVLWVARSGRVYGGAQAFAKLLIAAGGVYAPAGLLLRMPPIRWVAAGLYRVIANNRQRMPGGTAACAMPAPKIAA